VLAARDRGTLERPDPWDPGVRALVGAPAAGRVHRAARAVARRAGRDTERSFALRDGRDAIVHLHRLRALVDAVLVGVSTVVATIPRSPCGMSRARRRPRRARSARPAAARRDAARRRRRRRVVVVAPGVASPLSDGVERLEVAPDAAGAWRPPRS
jgi:riboflavin biosynthesis pyrimidine reductase